MCTVSTTLLWIQGVVREATFMRQYTEKCTALRVDTFKKHVMYYMSVQKEKWTQAQHTSPERGLKINEFKCSTTQCSISSLSLHETPDLNLHALFYLVHTLTGLKFVKVARVVDCTPCRA